MAISISATSEHLLRSFDRLIGALPVHAFSKQRAYIPRAWASERGPELAACAIDVYGGFPGSLKIQNRLQKGSLHLTENFLVIGEGSANGFALRLEEILAVSLRHANGLEPPALVVWYQDAVNVGTFLVQFRGTARNRHGHTRAQHLLDLLELQGVHIVQTTPFIPAIYCCWSSIEDVADDDVLWSGTAQASVGGPFGSQLDSVDVWLTDSHILWVARHGTGINKLALDQIIDCRNGYGDRLAIGIQDDMGGRYDVYFDFVIPNDRSQPAARIQQLLASAGVPTGHSNPPLAPWRSGGTRRPSDS